nr:MAG: replication initiator protein [Microviridae sp.]
MPCGKCDGCRKARSQEWAFRIMQEVGYFKEKGFFTFTYDDGHLPKGGSLEKAELQRFWKKVRKKLPGAKIKYFACGEYGEKYGRPHYHAIVLGLGPGDRDLLESIWANGSVDVGFVTTKSSRYVADYMCKKWDAKFIGEKELPFQVVSQGIGKRYAEKYKFDLMQKGYVSVDGTKLKLPRYYINYLKMQPLPKTVSKMNLDRDHNGRMKISEMLIRHADMVGVSTDKNVKWSDDDKRKIYKSMSMERRQMKLNNEARKAGIKKGAF